MTSVKDSRHLAFRKMERPEIPQAHRRKENVYLVVMRLNTVTEDHLLKLALWFRVHHGRQWGIIPTEEDIEASKGLNLMDLIPRCAVCPMRTFADRDECKTYMETLSQEYPQCNIQVLPWYDFGVVPPYTTTQRIYHDKELDQYLKQYNCQNRLNHVALQKRIKALETEHQQSVEKKGTMTEEEIEEEERRMADERNRPRTNLQRLGASSTSAPEPGDAKTVREMRDIVYDTLVRSSSYRETYERQIRALQERVAFYEGEMKKWKRVYGKLRTLPDLDAPPLVDELLDDE